MKVAFFSGCLEYSICLANALCNHADVEYFYSQSFVRSKDPSILQVLDPRLKRSTINNFRTRDIRNVIDFHALARKMNEYDVVHVQSGTIWLHLMRFCFKTPIVCTIHDPVQHEGLPMLKSLYQDFAQHIMVRQSRKTIVHGCKLKEIAKKRYQLADEDVLVVPHGEFSFYRQLAKPGKSRKPVGNIGTKMLLFFGAIRKNKGLEYLIKAGSLVARQVKDFRIVVAGKFENEPENNRSYYEGMIEDHERYVLMDEYIPNHGVAELFEEADIVVLPYISGSQSGVLSMALGYGKPVVATDVGSIGEVLEHGTTGLIVPPGDIEKLADALIDLLTHGEKREEFSRAARRIAEEQLSWDRIAEKTMTIYNSVTRCRKPCL